MSDGQDRPDGEFADLIECFEAAAFPVWVSPAVWAEEASREAAPILPWPLAQDFEGFPGMLRLYARDLVNSSLLSIGAAKGPAAMPTDPHNVIFQMVLRVVKRAVDSGEAAVLQRFSGAGRIGGKREWKEWHKRRLTDLAARSGLPRVTQAAVLKRLGVGSPATVYRHMQPRSKKR